MAIFERGPLGGGGGGNVQEKNKTKQKHNWKKKIKKHF